MVFPEDPYLNVFLSGVMNAADYYGLEELRRACAGFVQCCINVDTVCALLASAERYIQYKCTKTLVQKVLEFVDEHGNEVLNLGSFTLLPQHVVRLILAREELRADEFTKFQAALMWSKKYFDNNPVSGRKFPKLFIGFEPIHPLELCFGLSCLSFISIVLARTCWLTQAVRYSKAGPKFKACFELFTNYLIYL